MTEVTIYSGDTYHVFFFEGNTLMEVHMSCATLWSRVLDTCYLENQEHPLVSFDNDMWVCVPMEPEDLQSVSQTGGTIKLHADDLYSIKVDAVGSIEKGFIELFYE